MDNQRGGLPRQVPEDAPSARPGSGEPGRAEPGGELGARIRALATDAEQLEELFAQVRRAGDVPAFVAAVNEAAAEEPDNLLFAAWQARLRRVRHLAARAVHWQWAVPAAIASGLVLYLLSADRWWVLLDGQREVPIALLAAGPLSACFVLLYACLAGDRAWRRLALLCAGLLGIAAYGLWLQPRLAPRVFERQYVQLLALHLPIAAWSAIGLYVLRRPGDAEYRFAFLSRTLEVAAIGSLMAGTGGAFVAVTYGLFQAIQFELPDAVTRLLLAGGAGVVAVVAVALGYDPRLDLLRQDGEEGLQRIIVLTSRLLLPLTILVGVAYIPFLAKHFRVPFEYREVLVIYDAMLFAVAMLLVAAVPSSRETLHSRRAVWLRRGLAATASLALAVGLYALAAVVYRTAVDGWTPNRLVTIGWNILLIAILAHLLANQLRVGADRWAGEMRRSLALAPFALGGWALLAVLLPPWLFARPPQNVDALPEGMRWLVEELPPPILLKCQDRPEIYLLEAGQKRWIRDIPTFEGQRFRWDDVQYVPCDDLAAIEEGPPIPPDSRQPTGQPAVRP